MNVYILTRISKKSGKPFTALYVGRDEDHLKLVSFDVKVLLDVAGMHNYYDSVNNIEIAIEL